MKDEEIKKRFREVWGWFLIVWIVAFISLGLSLWAHVKIGTSGRCSYYINQQINEEIDENG